MSTPFFSEISVDSSKLDCTTSGGDVGKGDDLEERLVRFAVGVIDMTEGFPQTFTGQHLGNQLLRCATSTAANYAEARACESLRDFIHKLGIVGKEMNESRVWLKMVSIRKLAADEVVNRAFQECDELCRIIAVSRRTAEQNARAKGLRK